MAQAFTNEDLYKIAEKTLKIASEYAGVPSDSVSYSEAIVAMNTKVGNLALNILKERRKATK